MKRDYIDIIEADFTQHRQMVMISGPRQVGKTTLARSVSKERPEHFYLNWDDFDHRQLILDGNKAIADQFNLHQLREIKPILIFDEIHKFSQWKQQLKGFYDSYHEHCHILITGSARMDIYKKGGDSLMGRYFHYRLHPLSVREILSPSLSDIQNEIHPPQMINEEDYNALLQWGGFPEPYLKRDLRFFNRWSKLRDQQLLQEDIRELTRVQEIGQLGILIHLLKNQSGQLTSFSKLAKKVRVSVDTIRRWFTILESLYYCYPIRPWTKNITRSILKEPKYYLWDWSQCQDDGARSENFIASHLLKAVHFWTDCGLGDYSLHYLRDKEKREVDFLVSKNGEPWFMVEVKSSMTAKLSKNLEVFAKQLKIEHVFQVAIHGNFIDQDIFELNRPAIIPAKTFLSQLV